jgi:hypothetical protein
MREEGRLMRRDKIKTPDFDILARAYLGRGLSKASRRRQARRETRRD